MDYEKEAREFRRVCTHAYGRGGAGAELRDGTQWLRKFAARVLREESDWWWTNSASDVHGTLVKHSVEIEEGG